MFIIGIVGRIGSGKSTVAGILEKKLESCVSIDVDSLAKDVYDSEEDILKHIRTVFGEEVFDGESLDFGALADRVFSSSAELKKLNRIMFPLIRREVKNQIREYTDKDFVIIDAAVLFNCKLDVLCDYVIWVKASKDVRKKNLLNKGIPEQKAEMKIKGQKIRLCNGRMDYVIENNGDRKKLESICGKVAEDIHRRYGDING